VEERKYIAIKKMPIRPITFNTSITTFTKKY